MLQDKKILTGLDSGKYEHPFDRDALAQLKKVRGLDTILAFATEHAVEKVYSIQYTGSHLRVSKNRYPKIYEYLEYACKILDVDTIPELYIKWDYSIDANTVGYKNPIVVLNSGMLDLCTDDEILFLIGHEVGHIKSHHMLYHMTGEVYNYIMDMIPLPGIITKGAQTPIYFWDRMSDFTADRAGLLCCQNKEAMISALMKMAGVPTKGYGKICTESFIEQARAFHGLQDDKADKETKLIERLSIATSNEPWTVMRASELVKWIGSGEYEKCMM